MIRIRSCHCLGARFLVKHRGRIASVIEEKVEDPSEAVIDVQLPFRVMYDSHRNYIYRFLEGDFVLPNKKAYVRFMSDSPAFFYVHLLLPLDLHLAVALATTRSLSYVKRAEECEIIADDPVPTPDYIDSSELEWQDDIVPLTATTGFLNQSGILVRRST